MIKLLLQIVMPKQLNIGFGTAFAVGTFAFSALSAKKREKDIEAKQAEQTAIQSAVQSEQAGRERRKQFRQANILTAQAEAQQFAQSGQAAGGQNISGVASAVSANLSRNIGAINTSVAQSNVLSRAASSVASAGRPSTFDIFNQAAQPLIFSNVDNLNTFFESAFSSNTGTT